MTEEVFGIPSQTFMDMLTLVTNDSADEQQTTFRKVIHCKNIVFTAEFDKPCQAVDITKYPDWKCINPFLGSGVSEATGHHDCLKANDPTLVRRNLFPYYCCCSRAPQHTVAATYNYALLDRNAPAFCEGCATMHSKVTPCPMCGEVHP